MLAAGAITFGSSSVPIVAIGFQVIKVFVFYSSVFVSGEAVVQALAPYEKVQYLSRATLQDFSDMERGTRRLSYHGGGKPYPQFS